MTVRLVQGGMDGFDQPSKLALDVNRLHDYAVDHPEGFTHVDVELSFAWVHQYFQVVERALRSAMSAQKENLVCNPDEDNPSGLWVYRLTDDVELTDEWYANRLGDTETRLQSMKNIAESAVKARSGRTNIGKRARLIFKTTSRLLEDLEELRENSA